MFQWEWLTVLTSRPSRIWFDLMALVLSSSLRSHSQPALGDCVWRIWYPVVAESIIVFAETIEVKWMNTALCVLPLTPLWERWSINGCTLLSLLVSICTFKSSQHCFTCCFLKSSQDLPSLSLYCGWIKQNRTATPLLWGRHLKPNQALFSRRWKNNVPPNVHAEKFCFRIEPLNQDLTTENILLMLKMEEKSRKFSRLNAVFSLSNVCMCESSFTVFT